MCVNILQVWWDFLFIEMLGIEVRALHMLGNHSTTDLYAHPNIYKLIENVLMFKEPEMLTTHLSITHCIHASHYHIIPHKYIQLI
jgi:hypothetical protein